MEVLYPHCAGLDAYKRLPSRMQGHGRGSACDTQWTARSNREARTSIRRAG
jgi:hypothetical protein